MPIFFERRQAVHSAALPQRGAGRHQRSVRTNTSGITQSAAAAASASASNSQGALVQQTGSTIQNFDPAITGTLAVRALHHAAEHLRGQWYHRPLINSQDTGQFTLNSGLRHGHQLQFRLQPDPPVGQLADLHLQSLSDGIIKLHRNSKTSARFWPRGQHAQYRDCEKQP